MPENLKEFYSIQSLPDALSKQAAKMLGCPCKCEAMPDFLASERYTAVKRHYALTSIVQSSVRFLRAQESRQHLLGQVRDNAVVKEMLGEEGRVPPKIRLLLNGTPLFDDSIFSE